MKHSASIQQPSLPAGRSPGRKRPARVRTFISVALFASAVLLPLAVVSAQTTAGPDLQINTTTADYQRWPAVDMGIDGGFVVVWQDESGLDGSGAGVFGRVFDTTGTPGPELQLNVHTQNDQVRPDVAVNDDGSFVAVWDEFQKPGGRRTRNIIARLLASDGTPITGDLAVSDELEPGDGPNTHAKVALARNLGPVIGGGAMPTIGRFVVVWQRFEDVGRRDVWARIFEASGAPLSPPFRVNTTTAKDQERPDVAVFPDGSFVVVWDSVDQDDVRGVYGRRFAADGTALSGEFRIHQRTTDGQCCASVAPLAGGGFAVAYEGDVQDGDGRGVFVRFFNAGGQATAVETQVNQFTTGHQGYPSITTESSGELLIAWQSAQQDGDGRGVFARRLSTGGLAVGGEIPVNATTAGSQDLPAVARRGSQVVVVWRTYKEDGDGFGVAGRRFTIP